MHWPIQGYLSWIDQRVILLPANCQLIIFIKRKINFNSHSSNNFLWKALFHNPNPVSLSVFLLQISQLWIIIYKILTPLKAIILWVIPNYSVSATLLFIFVGFLSCSGNQLPTSNNIFFCKTYTQNPELNNQYMTLKPDSIYIDIRYFESPIASPLLCLSIGPSSN